MNQVLDLNVEEIGPDDVYIFRIKQWRYEIRKEGIKAFNPGGVEVTPGAKVIELFYTMHSGMYGEPLLTAEASKAFAVPIALTYVNARNEPVTPAEKISGIICKEADGSDARRFSLSKKDAPPFKVTNDGIIIYVIKDGQVIEEETWYLCSLFMKDKNCVRNYDAFFTREPHNVVKVIELADLNLC